jgi:L-methionine (R)-S-oxide reductase
MTTKTELYRQLVVQVRELFADERDLIANAANLAAVLYHGLPELNWAGFYFLKQGILILGPFQGKPACIRIALGKGVCGTAAATRKTVLVENVHEFPGHIACDGASNSEIVVPLLKDGHVVGVLDLDSPRLSRFDDEDRAGLELLVQGFIELTEIAVP